jgi:RNA polymerase sigma-70 factor (ECF subfamily)
MIHALPHPYRTAISRVALNGETQHDAAREMNISHSGMKSRVQRGREKLKAMLSQCCHVHLARNRGIVGYEARSPGCGACDSQAEITSGFEPG